MGVPETDPSDPIAIPGGSDGSDPQCPGEPPVNNGVSKKQVSPRVQYRVLDCSSMERTGGGRTVISILDDEIPIALDAMMVYDLGGDS